MFTVNFVVTSDSCQSIESFTAGQFYPFVWSLVTPLATTIVMTYNRWASILDNPTTSEKVARTTANKPNQGRNTNLGVWLGHDWTDPRRKQSHGRMSGTGNDHFAESLVPFDFLWSPVLGCHVVGVLPERSHTHKIPSTRRQRESSWPHASRPGKRNGDRWMSTANERKCLSRSVGSFLADMKKGVNK